MASNNTGLFQVSLNTARLKAQLIDYFMRALKKAENKLIELMREQISDIEHAEDGGHGAPEWEQDVMDAIREVYCNITSNYIECGVGIPEDSPEWLRIEASVYEYGVGDIYSKPGEIVWKSTSFENPRVYQGESNAETRYHIPALSQNGSYWVANSMKLLQKYFDDILDEACAEIPPSIFTSNIITKG